MKNKFFWFTGGFGVGITLISLGHAALPKGTAPTTAPQTTNLPKNVPTTAPVSPGKAVSGNALTEIKSGKVAGPDLEDDYARLTNEEAKYAESWAQQEKIRAATNRASKTQVHVKKKSKQ